MEYKRVDGVNPNSRAGTLAESRIKNLTDLVLSSCSLPDRVQSCNVYGLSSIYCIVQSEYMHSHPILLSVQHAVQSPTGNTTEEEGADS